MSDWHDEFTEPMHDTPADKDPLIAAMEAAGYTYDGLESTNDNLRFFGEGVRSLPWAAGMNARSG